MTSSGALPAERGVEAHGGHRGEGKAYRCARLLFQHPALVRGGEVIFDGIKIIQSPLCEMTVPVRKHKRRRSQSAAYHERIQKKWLKRFGTKKENVAIFMNPRAAGLLLDYPFVALHPQDFAVLRNFT